MAEPNSLCDQQQFTAFFREVFDGLYRYLYYRCGDGAQAQDLAQEALAKVWERCADILPKTAKAYTYRSANNLLINQHKRTQVQLKFTQQQTPRSTSEDPAFQLEEQEFRQRLETAISALPEKQRVVFLLSRIEKMTYSAIADQLGISRQAVEKRMYLALDTLRQRVSKKIR